MSPGTEFMVEDVVRHLSDQGIVTHDARAAGALIQRARKMGTVEAIGYAPAASSNGGPKMKWKRINGQG